MNGLIYKRYNVIRGEMQHVKGDSGANRNPMDTFGLFC